MYFDKIVTRTVCEGGWFNVGVNIVTPPQYNKRDRIGTYGKSQTFPVCFLIPCNFFSSP